MSHAGYGGGGWLQQPVERGQLQRRLMSDQGEADLPAKEITSLLRAAHSGDRAAQEDLFRELYTELHRRAQELMRGQADGHTLQATALVGELYLRIFGRGERAWTDRQHFLLSASRVMRHVLVDHARRKHRRKREGVRVDSELDQMLVEFEDRALDLEALDKALERLEELDPGMAKAVDLRFFAGISAAEAARALDLPRRTFDRRWQMTRAWLYRELQ